MFQAMRRVISDSEDVGKSHKKAKTTMNSVGPETAVPPPAATPSPASHLVEPDNNFAPLEVVHPPRQADHYASNSSLSDGSEHGEEDALVPSITQLPPKKKPETKEQIVPQSLQRVDRNILNLMDSAADGSSSGSQQPSSQTSSRDWGWFEDVHQSSDGLANIEKRDTKKMIPRSRAPDMAPPENTHGKSGEACGSFVHLVSMQNLISQFLISRRQLHGSDCPSLCPGGVSQQSTTLERHGGDATSSASGRAFILRVRAKRSCVCKEIVILSPRLS